MSLLIKALDKAQEEAQTAKGKQKAKHEAEAQLVKAAASADNKRQPAALSLSPAEPSLASAHTKSNAASEKIAVANALELELSPNIKPDNNALHQTLNIKNRSEKSDDIHAKLNAGDKPVLASTNLPASRDFINSKDNNNTASANINAANINVTKSNAANVFAAKRIEANHQNSKIAFIVGAAVIVLSAIGAYFYQWVDNGSDLTFVAQRPVMPAPAQQSVPASSQMRPAETQPLPDINPSSNAVSTSVDSESSVSNSVAPQNNAELTQATAQKIAKAQTEINTLRLAPNEKAFDAFGAESQPAQSLKETDQFEADRANTVQIASKSASIQVSKSTEQSAVNPALMRAYDAYNAGNDAEAVKLYKQVLQRDVRNVDALLGLGAIAQRQGRLPDANGWYGKVLELDPKNSIALNFNLAANSDNQAPNEMNNESRIKNMLAKQPDDASLHTTLGNFYADANQWSAAQQAYFDAYRLNASADNAFNLAISLDQLGKPKLALPYYQRALQLSQTTRTNVDKAALEARISAIQ